MANSDVEEEEVKEKREAERGGRGGRGAGEIKGGKNEELKNSDAEEKEEE